MMTMSQMLNVSFDFNLLLFMKLICILISEQKLKDMPDSWAWTLKLIRSSCSLPKRVSRLQCLSHGRLTTTRTMSYFTSTKLPAKKCLITLWMKCTRRNSKNLNLRKKADLTYLLIQCTQITRFKYLQAQSVQTRPKILSSELKLRRR